MKKFIGRTQELQWFEDLAKAPRPALVVIRGRRRVGKSRLALEFGKGRRFLSFSGMAPTGTSTAQDQRDEFAQQLCAHFHLPPMTFNDWSNGFAHLTKYLTQEPTVILLDEISWMGSEDVKFIPKLKIWWDMQLQDFPNLTVIICGSVSTWIEENILKSTAFFGRISAVFDLQPFSLSESYEFLRALGIQFSAYDVLRLLAVMGGIPWYLEQVTPHLTVEENIRKLCFNRKGNFVTEYETIFHDLYEKRGTAYKRIVEALADRMKNLAELREELGYAHGGALGEYVNNLCISGFVTKHYDWSLKTGKIGRQSYYRLSDNYLRFYIKYIQPQIESIKQGAYEDVPVTSLPAWESIMGIHVENLLLQNRSVLLKALGIQPVDIIADNPYVQSATTRQKGCQIDYMVQTRTKNLFICEFKYKSREIGLDIIQELEEKIGRLVVPKGYAVCPVLVHISGVTVSVIEKGFFYRCIDVLDLLEGR